MEKISLLESINFVRVVVIHLSVPTDNTSDIPKKLSGKGRPPLPLASKKWYGTNVIIKKNMHIACSDRNDYRMH